MSRIAYVNGRYVPHRDASVHVEDRGYQFADGVYEVCAVAGGRIVDAGPHYERLERSLRELRILPPMSRRSLDHVLNEVIRRNRIVNGIVYLQVTRGVARRDHAFPKGVPPALVVTARATRPEAYAAQAEVGVKVVTLPDIRWERCDIKSVSLLPNVLAKQQARQAGAWEAWLVDDEGYVTEGSSTNAWIVDRDGNIVTRHLDNGILGGVTRLSMLELARREGVSIVERKFSVEEAKAAREAFSTSTTAFVMPIVQIDEAVVGNGHPGIMTLKLRDIYGRYAAGDGRVARMAAPN
ncbi:MAG TPA: D-amino-acid transaminase [Stellaceae bacterium]|nr:D-amino-acid transaminase [Stellaceae bacterium]